MVLNHSRFAKKVRMEIRMKALKKLMLIGSLGFLIGGCASAPQQIPFIETKRGETEVGTTARAYVGDIIYRKFDIREQFEAYVTGAVNLGGASITLTDTRVQRMLINGSDGAAVRDPLIVTSWMGIPSRAGPLLLIDETEDGAFDRYIYMNLNKGELKQPIFVDWEQSNRSNGFQRELIYQGRDGNNLKLFYREFNGDFRRPAYDQAVQYDLSVSDYIQFKGLTIFVEEANNEYLIYTIEGGSL